MPVVSELLQWRLRYPESLLSESLADGTRDGYRRMIDQLVSATQLRHPAIGDLARQVRYRCFDAPLIAAERTQAQQRVRAELDRLSSDPETRAAQIDAIVASGEPILGVFAERHHPVMLEVMTRRYYRIRPLRKLNAYTQKVIRARRRGTVYPYELIPLITRSPDRGGSPGIFTEYDLDEAGAPVPVDREPGLNTANLVLGVVSTPTRRYPEGMRRVVLLGDPTQALGALAEPECRRVLAAIHLARQMQAPLEWFAISAGAKISMDSGTETMDWISRALRGIIEFTQDGGEINVVVTGINVGAQPYWNAEATMLMHTKGVLIMTPDSAMVLTGKQSLDYSGGVSADDNFGIGGYDRIMGPNGEAQYWAPDLSSAVDVLLAHYENTYVFAGERFPRSAPTTDPADRGHRRLAAAPVLDHLAAAARRGPRGQQLSADLASCGWR